MLKIEWNIAMLTRLAGSSNKAGEECGFDNRKNCQPDCRTDYIEAKVNKRCSSGVFICSYGRNQSSYTSTDVTVP
jgi:hypothetical protein